MHKSRDEASRVQQGPCESKKVIYESNFNPLLNCRKFIFYWVCQQRQHEGKDFTPYQWLLLQVDPVHFFYFDIFALAFALMPVGLNVAVHFPSLAFSCLNEDIGIAASQFPITIDEAQLCLDGELYISWTTKVVRPPLSAIVSSIDLTCQMKGVIENYLKPGKS